MTKCIRMGGEKCEKMHGRGKMCKNALEWEGENVKKCIRMGGGKCEKMH